MSGVPRFRRSPGSGLRLAATQRTDLPR
jgi:hypothetical protein